MNGRLYDPVLARFVSADPYVQEPFNLQSLNRYSYVLNNPMGYTDPSGYFFKSFFKKILPRLIAGIADLFGCSGYCTAAVNTYMAYKQGGAGAALISGYQGFNQQNSIFGTSSYGTYGNNRTVSNNIVSNGQSVRFDTQQFIVNAVLAGTATKLSGGKFANGALSGAFAYANNILGDYREYAQSIFDRPSYSCADPTIECAERREQERQIQREAAERNAIEPIGVAEFFIGWGFGTVRGTTQLFRAVGPAELADIRAM